MKRSRVFIKQSRFDHHREIESRDEDVDETQLAQSGKETEIFETNDGYSALTIPSRVAEQMQFVNMRNRRQGTRDKGNRLGIG